MKRALFLFLLLGLSGCFFGKKHVGPVVSESPIDIAARATAPVPDEVQDETQGRVLACGAAASMGQTALLDHVLKKRAASGKPLAEAEIPYIEVQKHLRTVIKNARVVHTSVEAKSCTVTIAISKMDVRAVLKEAK